MVHLPRFFALTILFFGFSLSAVGNDSSCYQKPVRYEDVFDRSEWEVELAKNLARSSLNAVLAIAKLPGYSAAALITMIQSAHFTASQLVEHLQEPYLGNESDEGDGAPDLLQEADSQA